VTDAEHADSFRFTGDITEFTFHRGEAEILIDGDRVAPEDI
jgi:hypothetical protein